MKFLYAVSILFTLSELISSAKIEKAGPATVNFYIWAGPDPSTAIRSRENVTVSANSTFFKVMEVAASQRVDYEFTYEELDGFGAYITSIGGVAQNPSESIFWMFYQLPSIPDVLSPPTDQFLTSEGISTHHVSDGDIYLFWLKNTSQNQS